MSPEAENLNTGKIILIIFSICFAAYGGFFCNYDGHHLGVFSRLILFVIVFIGCYIGANIGNILRKVALPDSIFTTGGMIDILKVKLFWTVGPQLIGFIAGGVLGGGLALGIVG